MLNERIELQGCPRIRLVAAAALATIHDLRQNRPPSVRLAAAKELLDRGVGPIPSRSAVVQAEISVEDLLAALGGREVE